MNIPEIGWTLGNPKPSYRKMLVLQTIKRIAVALLVVAGLFALSYMDGLAL